ncbi:MAG TPA: M90 family metallopeptidase [Chitinophagaceae bacterium]|jgi:Mlc titration factor MtfA (ptsG expression regulator)|nr:M90 family metallopeptidase [Chitinophagaceae bacterium]
MQAIETAMLALGVIAVLVLFLALFMHSRKKTPVRVQPIPGSYKELLSKDVVFYNNLDSTKQREFEYRMMHFLATTRITGVRTGVEDTDRVYIAASAIIPIFGFPNWEYTNLNEVLLYPDSFNHEFEQTGNDRSILGMVGNGPYNNIMILSRHELRQAFVNKTSKSNTAIHEFVHLVDMTDGVVDGVPEYFVDRKYVLPWLQLIREEIKKIMDNRSDINPYGATNEAEFFAVVSEYFFERPDLLESKHPELYKLLAQAFHQQPGRK